MEERHRPVSMSGRLNKQNLPVKDQSGAEASVVDFSVGSSGHVIVEAHLGTSGTVSAKHIHELHGEGVGLQLNVILVDPFAIGRVHELVEIVFLVGPLKDRRHLTLVRCHV